jgi:hypothetical protein
VLCRAVLRVPLASYTGLSLRNLDAVGLKNIFMMLQQHYVEHLDKLFMVNASSIFWGLWRVVSPFIDPVTRAKIVFVGSTDVMVQELGPEVGVVVCLCGRVVLCQAARVGWGSCLWTEGCVRGQHGCHGAGAGARGGCGCVSVRACCAVSGS